MHFKLAVLLTLLFSVSTVISQSSSLVNKPIYQQSYDKKDGLEIDFITGLETDQEGWLWISGVAYRSGRYRNENQSGKLFRFNGSFFQEIELPEKFEENHIAIFLHTLSSRELIVSLVFSDDIVMYRLDLSSLVFTELKFSKPLPTNFPKPTFHHVGSDDLLVILSGSDYELYSLDGTGHFSHITDLTFLRKEQGYRISVEKNGFLFHLDDGSRYQVAKKGGQINKIDNSVEKTSGITIDYIKDQVGNFLYQNQTATEIELNITRDLYSEPRKVIRFPGPNRYRIASNDFRKSIFLANRTTLFHVIFSSSKVLTFLPDYSVRSILPLKSYEYLVGTETKGSFIVNTRTGVASSFLYQYEGKAYTPLSNRQFFSVGDSIWSNDSDGLILMKNLNPSIERFPSERMSCLIKEGRYIYGGTVRSHLLVFDTVEKNFRRLDRTDSLDFSDIDKRDSIIYGATNKGLYIYNGVKGRLLQDLSAHEDRYILSINIHPEYGILLGTQSGKLFVYDENSERFTLLYEDEIKASIADLLFDDHGNIWINTFAGIVKFNPETKTIERFDEGEGLSHYESNRYSSLKTEDGHFFVGTLKGLNYFHPDSLEPFESTAKLELVSLQYFDKASKSLVSIKDVERLEVKKEIILPAENRNLKLDFVVNGNETAQNVHFRYTLDGDEWRTIDSKNRLELINLAPGSYDLKIKALSYDQEIIGNAIELRVVSKDFFYNTKWFIFFAISFMSALAIWLLVGAVKRGQLHQEFSQKIIDAAESQKAEIARELHDSVGQKLVLLSQNASYADDKESKSLIANTLDELRSISKGLHPSIMERLGATAAIQSLVDDVDENSSLFISSEIANIDPLVDDKTALHIYRIIQECLGNIIKHSEAQAAEVKVVENAERIEIEISDNGTGFDYSEVMHQGLGMRTLVERAAIIHSKLSFSSIGGNGTLVKLSVPLRK